MHSSPYIVSNWVEGAHFYGRADLCTVLTSTNERCIYLVGMRRIGKTSLLKRIDGLLNPCALYCDLMQAASQEGGRETLDETRLVRLLRRELNRRASEPTESPHHTLLRQSRPAWEHDAPGLVPWLEDASWQWEELGLTMTLLWDEAEMLRRLPTATLMGLRAVLQHSPSLRIIICASKGLAALNDFWREAGVSPFLFGFKTYYLSGLTDQEANELIAQRGQVQATSQTTATIRWLTGNHPFLLQMLCDRVYRAGVLREPQRQDLLVEPMLADLFRIDVAYLSPGEQRILLTLARQGPLSSLEVQQQASLSAEVLHSFAHGMLQLGYLRTGEAGRWYVGNEFLAQWLRYHPPQTNSAVTDRASLEVVDAAQAAAPPPLAEPLSEREHEVLRLLAAGQRNPEIARVLTISENTVKAHVKNIYRKLGINDRVQAINRARALRLI